MSSGKQVFTQQQFTDVGDADANLVCAALLDDLTATAGFNPPRAVLYGQITGFRTTLFVDFGGPLRIAGPLNGFLGFWLAERENGLVGCYGCERASGRQSVGGRVIHDLPVFDSSYSWVNQLASALASTQVAGIPSTAAPGNDFGAAADVLTRVVEDLLRAALHAFCTQLDADALSAAHTEATPTVAVYNHYRAANAQQHRNRVQAALTYPLFSSPLRCDWQLRRAVDTGVPLTPMLAERFQVRAGTIRRIRGVAPLRIAPYPLTTVLKRVDGLRADAIPVEESDWAVFLRLIGPLETLAEVTALNVNHFLSPFAKGWRSGLDTLERQLQAPLNIDAILEMMHCAFVYGVRPAVEEALAEARSNATVRTDPPAGFYPLWFGRYGLMRLAQMAVRWRETLGQFSLKRLGADTHLGEHASLAWPGLLSGTATHDNLRVIELTSHETLDLEGRRLEHCVASYAIKCLTDDSCIFSIRDRFDRSLSTFEVRVSAAGAAQLLRHHALDNAAPSAKLGQTAQRFVERVLSQVPQERIDAVRAQRREIGHRLRDVLGRPDQEQRPLTPSERCSLSAAIAFAHPSEAQRHGIAQFLRERGRQVAWDMLTP